MKRKLYLMKSLLSTIFVSAVVLIFTSCPSTIDKDDLNQVKDETGPVVEINSHQDGDLFTQTEMVSGTVSDTADTSGGQITAFSYEIRNQLKTLITYDFTAEELAEITSSGSFSFDFQTTTFGGDIIVEVSAEDWNSNISKDSVTLAYPGSDVPSFSVTPGNKQVSLSWEEVPGAESYTIYYSTDGTEPSENYGEKIENITTVFSEANPLILGDIENGNLHVFLMKAESSDGQSYWLSDYIEAIPLSPMTLVPTVKGRYREISIEWRSIQGADEFEVWRSTDKTSGYINISGTYKGNSFVDTQVEEEQTYFYKVKPAVSLSIESGVTSAQTSPFPPFAYRRYTGSCDTPDKAWRVAVKGNYAYVADSRYATSSTGLQIFDISDPFSPVLAGSYTTNQGDFTDIVIDGNYAYIAASSLGLLVFDISDPLNPALAGSCDERDGLARAVAVQGDYAYITNYESLGGGENELLIIDILDPENPSLEDIINLENLYGASARGIDVSGEYAYLATYDDKHLRIVGIDPEKPSFKQLVGSWATDSGQYAYNVKVKGIYAYLAQSNEGLKIINITDPSDMSVVAVCDTNGRAYWIFLQDDIAYIADGGGGLAAIDISNPVSPAVLYTVDTPGSAYGVAVADGYAFIAGYNTGLHIIDITPPPRPELTASYNTDISAYSVCMQGNYAFVADPGGYLQAIDISNPSELILADSCDLEDNYAYDLCLCGGYAFIACGSDGFKVIDISVPENLILKSSLEIESHVGSITASGNYLFIAADTSGMKIFDVSFTENPLLVSNYITSERAYDVAVQGNYAYIAESSNGVSIVDISNPSFPVLTGSFDYEDPPSSFSSYSIAVEGNYVYTACQANFGAGVLIGVQILDISFPANPLPVGGYFIPEPGFFDAVTGITVTENYVYFTYNSELWVLDVSAPSDPRLISTYPSSGYAMGVAVSGGYSYMADSSAGVHILNLLPDN